MNRTLIGMSVHFLHNQSVFKLHFSTMCGIFRISCECATYCEVAINAWKETKIKNQLMWRLNCVRCTLSFISNSHALLYFPLDVQWKIWNVLLEREPLSLSWKCSQIFSSSDLCCFFLLDHNFIYGLNRIHHCFDATRFLIFKSERIMYV